MNPDNQWTNSCGISSRFVNIHRQVLRYACIIDIRTEGEIVCDMNGAVNFLVVTRITTVIMLCFRLRNQKSKRQKKYESKISSHVLLILSRKFLKDICDSNSMIPRYKNQESS